MTLLDALNQCPSGPNGVQMALSVPEGRAVAVRFRRGSIIYVRLTGTIKAKGDSYVTKGDGRWLDDHMHIDWRPA